MASNPREGVFTSPTESEFSEKHDGPDSVRYVLFSRPAGIAEEILLTGFFLGSGMKRRLRTGYIQFAAVNMSHYSEVHKPTSGILYGSPVFSIG